jgi:hypothetical protein
MEDDQAMMNQVMDPGILKDIRPPVEMPYFRGGWILAILAFVLVVAVIWLMWWKKRQPRERARESPRERFLRVIEELGRFQGFDNKRSCYEILSCEIRLYLEGVMGIAMVDKTTEEIRLTLDRQGGKNSLGDVEFILDILRRADRVKFAGENISVEQMKDDQTAVLRWARGHGDVA